MCQIVFEKMKGRDGTERVLMQKQPSDRFLKKSVTRNFAKFTRKHMCQKNETIAQAFSCEICEICKNIFFAEHHWTTASDYSSINRSELTNETINYDTKTKA